LNCLNSVNDGSADAVCLLSHPSNIYLIEGRKDFLTLPLFLINIEEMNISNSSIDTLSHQYFNQIIRRIK